MTSSSFLSVVRSTLMPGLSAYDFGEDIVDLGVIVGDTQRNFASCQLIQQDLSLIHI